MHFSVIFLYRELLSLDFFIKIEALYKLTNDRLTDRCVDVLIV